MKKCPQCDTEQESEDITSCPTCGYNFAAKTDPIPTSPPPDEDDDLEFQVYEKETEDREFVGGQHDFQPGQPKDDLGVQRPEDLMETRAHESGSKVPDPIDEPIGQSAPFIPTPEPYEPEPTPASSADFSDLRSEEPPEDTPDEASPNGIKKLSEEEVRAIESNLYRGRGYLSDSDKKDLLHKLDENEQLFTATPIAPPKHKEKPPVSNRTVSQINQEIDASLPKPKMANRGRGVAYYYRNFIQLKGHQHPLPEEELMVGGRTYDLRPFTIDKKLLIGAGAFVFIILLFAIGSLFVSSPSGSGQIAGIVLDENDQPFVQGATIRLPDLNEDFKSTGEGTFITDRIPAGSHRVELVWKGKTWASDYATVADNQVSVIVLRPNGEQTYGTVSGGDNSSSRGNRSSSARSSSNRRASAANSHSGDSPDPRARSSTGDRSRPGKLVLNANVGGARLQLGKTVLGAGNLTYDEITPGTYSYKVTKDGYKSVSGRVTIPSGGRKTLAVTLEELQQQAKEKQYTASDFYYSGQAGLQEQDYAAAVKDLKEAVRRKPGNPEYNFSLGDAYAGLKDWPNASKSYVRAAEQFRINKDYNRSMTAYNQAVAADDGSIPAYLGRADLFMAEKELQAAIMDYKTVIRLNNRNAPAYIGLGRARFEQGIYDKAIKHFKDARSIDPHNPIANQYLILCYMADGNLDQVKKAYQKYSEVASPEEIKRLRNDSRFTAVFRVVDSKE